MTNYISRNSLLDRQIKKAEEKDTIIQELTKKYTQERIQKLVIAQKIKRKLQRLEALRTIERQYKNPTERDRAFYALKIIKTHYPSNTEAILMFALIQGAVLDLFSGKYDRKENAAFYILGPMKHAQWCGVEPEWIRKQLKKAHIHVSARILKIGA